MGMKDYCMKKIQPQIDFWDMDVSIIALWLYFNFQNVTCEDVKFDGL